MQDQDELKRVESHFEFGENWQDYIRLVNEDAVAEARSAITRLIPADKFQGARFLDIGCGSGLHSLAATQLGVAELVAIDIDPRSVEATNQLLGKFGALNRARVLNLSIFDAERTELGAFDIVYSWGVLHHTGSMWPAIEKAATFVAPGGIFTIALYQKRPLCGAWTVEKAFYTKAGARIRKALRGAYKAAFYAGLAVTGRNPVTYLRDYKTKRGMDFYVDVHDWLGGYPYESASPEEVRTRVSGMGFELLFEKTLKPALGVLGTGCAEYSFRRVA